MDMNILVKEPIKSNDKSASISIFPLARNNNTVIVPVFGLKGDEKVAGTVEEVLRGNRILTINVNEIAKDGGVFKLYFMEYLSMRVSNLPKVGNPGTLYQNHTSCNQKDTENLSKMRFKISRK